MGRKHDIVYVRRTNSYNLIAKDDHSLSWFTVAEDLSYEIADAAIVGLSVGAYNAAQ